MTGRGENERWRDSRDPSRWTPRLWLAAVGISALSALAGWAGADSETPTAGAEVHRITGQVVDVLGQPVPFLRVRGVELSCDQTYGSLGPTGPGEATQGNAAEEPGSPGAFWGDDTTDARGWFELSGLRPGKYVLRWADDRGSDHYARLLHPDPVASGEGPLRCGIERAGILVTWVDGRGLPIRSDEAAILSVPSVPRPRVLGPPKLDAWDDPMPPFCNALSWGAPLPDGRWYFEASPGETYRVGAWDESTGWEPKTLELGALGAATPIRLPLPIAVPSGVVRIEVRSPAGAILDREYGVHIVDAVTGDPLTTAPEARWPSRRRITEFRLPLGQYRAIADARAEWALDSRARRRPFGRGEREFTISDGGAVDLDISLGVGARIDLELTGSIEEADFEGVRRRRSAEGLESEAERAWGAALAGVSLRRQGTPPVPVHFVFGGDGQLGGASWGLRDFPGIPLGQRGLSERTAAGRYELVAELIGGRRVSASVELFNGETTRVCLSFADGRGPESNPEAKPSPGRD